MDNVEQIKLIADRYDLIVNRLVWVGLFIFVGWYFYWRPSLADNPTPAMICIPISFGVGAYSILFAQLYIKYFGIPTILTFGFRIGGVLPPTCEASMPIEGKDGLPCSLKRFAEWGARAMARWELAS